MIRSFVLADFITLANAGFGMAAIFLCLNRVTNSRTTYFWAVFILLPLALVLLQQGHGVILRVALEIDDAETVCAHGQVYPRNNFV